MQAVSYTHLDVYKRQILFSEWYFNGDKVATVSGIKHIYTQMNINQKFYDLLNNVNFNGNDFLSLKIYFDKYEDTTPNTNICLLYTSRCV